MGGSTNLLLSADLCVDRSNWCGCFKDVSCSPDMVDGSPIESTLELDSGNGHTAQVNLHTDGTLRFETHNGQCVHIDKSQPPTTAASTDKGILNLGGKGGPARMYIDSTNGKMTIQAQEIMINDANHVTDTAAACEVWVTQAPTVIAHQDTCTNLRNAAANPDHTCQATDEGCVVSANLVVDQLQNQFSTECGTELNFDLKDYVVKYTNDRPYPINLYANTCYENTDFDITLSVYRVTGSSCTQLTCVDDWDAHDSQKIHAGESLVFSVTASDFIHRSTKRVYGEF